MSLVFVVLLEQPALSPPDGHGQLVLVAGELLALPEEVATVCLPFAAGLGELLAMAGFWCGRRRADTLATLGLLLMFALVTLVHWHAGAALLPPIVFMGIALLKLVTVPTLHSKKD